MLLAHAIIHFGHFLPTSRLRITRQRIRAGQHVAHHLSDDGLYLIDVGPFDRNTTVNVIAISGSGTYSDPTAAGISNTQSNALVASFSGGATTIGLDGSYRLATLSRGSNTITVTRPNSTTVLLTMPNVSPLPASVVTITLDGSGRNTGVSGNFI